MRLIEGTADELKQFFGKGCLEESKKITEMFNLAQLTMPWEEDFENWTVDTLSLTKLEEAIIKGLTNDVLPRHMKIHDWNLPYAEGCILAIRREIAKLNGATCEKDTNFAILDRESKHFSSMDLRHVSEPDARGEHRNGQPRTEPTVNRCRICGFTEVNGIFNIDNWASLSACACCASNNYTPEVSISFRPWLKAINTNAGKEENAAKTAMVSLLGLEPQRKQKKKHLQSSKGSETENHHTT